MRTPITGTREWFDTARLDILEGTRAAQSLNMATESVATLVSRWEELDVGLAFALTTNCIVNYCRPFVERRTNRGSRHYKLKIVAKTPGFDVALHRHLMQLRHKMVTHSDEDFLDAKLAAQIALFSTDSRAIKVLAKIDARSTAFWLIREKATAERWLTHCRAALTGASHDVAEKLGAYFDAAKQYPDICPLMDERGAQRIGSGELQLKEGETSSIRLPDTPISDLKMPPFTEAHGAYVLQVLSLSTTGGGTTITDLGDGLRLACGSDPTAFPSESRPLVPEPEPERHEN